MQPTQKRVQVIEPPQVIQYTEAIPNKSRSRSPQKNGHETTMTSSPEIAAGIPNEEFINVNRRHQKDFNKQKSSNAMRTLLKADENAE